MTPAERSTRPLLDPSFVADHRRRRYMAAVAELCVERGFRATTVADIVARAHTSRNSFYDLYGNREEVFAATFEHGVAELRDAVERACAEAGEDPGRRLEAGLAALLEWVAADPASAWVCLVEPFTTPATFARYLEEMSRFATLLRESRPAPVGLPEAVDESLAGGVAAILSGQLRAGLGTEAPRLLPNLVTLVRGPAA